MAAVRRDMRVDAPNVTDTWALFVSLEHGIAQRLSTFGSGDFYTQGYSVTHQGSMIRHDTVEAARASSRDTLERLDVISVSFNEDARSKRRAELIGDPPKDPFLPGWEEGWKQYNAWGVDRTRCVILVVHKDPSGGSWSYLVVEGDNQNEVFGFFENLTAMVKARTDALVVAHPAAVAPAAVGARPAPSRTGIRRAWQIATNQPLSVTIIGTVVGGLILAGIVAGIVGIVK